MTTIDVYDTWIALQQIVNVQQNGQIPPHVFLGWYNEVNLQLFKKYAEEFQLNQVMSDLLNPFLSEVNILASTATQGGNWSLFKQPADYEYFVNMSVLRQLQEDTCFTNSKLPIIDGKGKAKPYTDPDFAALTIKYATANVNEYQIQKIDAQRWSACLNHATKQPSWASPKMTQYDLGFKVAPQGINSVVLKYLHTPAEATFVYTVSAQDIAIYNGPASQQLEWSDQVLPIFLGYLVKKYAAYVADGGLMQIGENMVADAK